MAYVEVTELQRVLGKPAPTAAELDAMERVLAAAAQDIDWDLAYTVENPAPTTPDALALLADVNLNRAQELWRLNKSTGGIVQIAPEDPLTVTPRDTWYRHHLRLNPLRTAWGVA